MSRITRVALAAAGAVATAAALMLPATATADPARPASPDAAYACSQAVPAGYATCFTQINTAASQQAGKAPAGYGPAQLKSAYKLGRASGAGKTVAIVDAFDNPKAESDLRVYRRAYGLRPCTTANGCFKKVNQTGGTNYPPSEPGWAAEISLDLDMVSATCADCKILLVEAKDNSFSNLGAAVNYAATQGVAAISNSYGGSDNSQLPAYDHPGIAVTASTGDSGYGVSSPASFRTVIAVGGTSLHRAASTTRGWREGAWDGAGSGCSTLNSRPSWQTPAATECSGKALADVSAVADPATGVAVYNSFSDSGWAVYGGTSASAPIIGSVYAMAGPLVQYPASFTWAHRTHLYDVKSGSNGICFPNPSQWCNAGPGWDGPTGLGTPNGVGSF